MWASRATPTWAMSSRGTARVPWQPEERSTGLERDVKGDSVVIGISRRFHQDCSERWGLLSGVFRLLQLSQ